MIGSEHRTNVTPTVEMVYHTQNITTQNIGDNYSRINIMPYITQNKRSRLDPHIDRLHNELVKMEIDGDIDDSTNNMEGNLNYTITKLLSKVYSTPSYREINDALGMLECCKLEYYRRAAVDYEEQKRAENGDVVPNLIQRELNSLSNEA